MGYLKRVLAITVMIFVAGCGARMARQLGEPIVKPADTKPTTEQKADENTGKTARTLSGTLTLTDDAKVDLSTITQPVILIFAAYTCGECKEEAKEISAFFTQKTAQPSNMKIFSVLAGSGKELALKWKAKNGVTWPMAYDENNEAFVKFCPPPPGEMLSKTPCTVTFNPEKDETPKMTIGRSTIEHLEAETGPWKF